MAFPESFWCGGIPGIAAKKRWRYTEIMDVSMVLSASEESLINVLRMLSPDEARKVLNWARQLADVGSGRRFEWSDSWSDDDVRDATRASLERFERQEREER